MTIDDLRQTLATISQEVESLDERSRLAGVHGKVVRARRRRVGAAIGCAGVVAVLALAAPGLLDVGDHAPGPSDHPKTSTRTRSVLPTVQDKGTSFYTSPAGDTLLGEKMGRPGDRSVTLRVVPTTTDLAYRSVCWRAGRQSSRLLYSVHINGKPIKSASCDGEPDGPLVPNATFGSGPPSNRSAWRTYVGVVPGKPITLQVSLRKSVFLAGSTSPVQLGIALYADTGPMGHEHGTWFARQVVIDGHTYAVVRRGFGHVRGVHGELRLALPSPAEPLYLVYGIRGAHSAYVLYGDSSASTSQTAGPSSYGEPARPGQKSARVAVRLHGKPGATLYILAYRQVD